MSYCPLGIKNKPGKNKIWTPFFLLLVLLDLIVTVLSGDSFSRYNFPPGFTFGAGTSAYQVEGAASEDGRTPSIWDTFAHAGYMHGANGDIACDEYHKYKEDVQLMVDTGLDAYKFSISWSRLIPNGRGPLNPKGLQYYNNLINELISHGIQPHVTLHNYDLPQILEDEYGGWLNRRIVEDFTAYADVCFREFGDRVSYWTTVNEPNIFAIGGYDVGIVPPKRCSPPFGTICPRGNSSSEPYIAVHNMLLAHASAARLYEREYKGKQHGFVGISIYAMGLTPLTNSTKDAIATQRAKDFFIGWIAHPLVFGDYPDIMKKNVGSRMPTFTAEESKQVKGAFDFLGVIHYVSAYVVDNPGSLELKQRDFNADMAATLISDTGASLPVELPITPWHLQEVLEYLKQDYGNPTVYILENGQPMLRNSSLEDTLRVKYVYAYIGAVLDAVRNGSNTRGYFLWSFLDLFELLSGYESSYGLYHVDLDDPDLKRYPKLSAHWYSSFLKGNNVSSDGFTELGKTEMSNSFLDLQIQLLRLTGPILECLNKTHYTPEESSNVSTREILDSLLPNRSFEQNPNITEHEIRTSIKHFALACALLSSSQSSTHELLSWIPKNLSDIAESAFREISRGYIGVFGERNANRIGKFGLDCGLLSEEKRFLVELMPEILPGLKERIKESSIDKSDENNEFTAASARVPVVYAILCAYQFRWFVTQVDHPYLGKLCNMVIPCALTALDHWSPEVKGQGMIIFTYLAKNVNATEFGCYQDVILDACCQNIACSDEIWHHVAEMSALLVTSIQKNNPRSSWFEKILNEMLSHLERQPRNKDRRVAWLRSIEPLFSAVGLVLLAHFRRLFPLFFKWMHVDDDETVLLVLKRVHTVLRLTWIRNTPYIERLVDELVVLYKEAALKKGCEEIRTEILRVLSLLKQCKGLQFEAAWDKHREDPNLSMLHPSLSSGRNVQTQRSFAENAHEGGSEPLRAQ